MKNKRVISIILGILIIIIAIIMPFRLKEICYDHSLHLDWSLGSWNAVFISAFFYSIIISVLTLFLVLINVLDTKKNK